MEAIATVGAHFYFPSSTRHRRISNRTCRFVGLHYDGGNGILPAGLLRLRGSWSCHRSHVQDDLDSLLAILPKDLQEGVVDASKRSSLVEIILDLGRLPEARYLGESRAQALRTSEVKVKELEYVLHAVGGFLEDNRAGIPGTLHRISAIKNREGEVVGLTCRVGRAINGAVNMVHDLLNYGKNILFVGRPGVGKTTTIRDAARVLSNELSKRVVSVSSRQQPPYDFPPHSVVLTMKTTENTHILKQVIVDTSNEIGGDGDVPHPAIGSARRLQVPNPSLQHRVMIEAVENHMPEVVIVDEISTAAEASACQSIATRGVMMIGTVHGETIESVLKNPSLSKLVGGVQAVVLGDGEARMRGCQKTILERKTLPTFPFLIEMRERHFWILHRTEKSVDKLMLGKLPLVEVRRLDNHLKVVVERWSPYTRM